jgi:hypothetical protein
VTVDNDDLRRPRLLRAAHGGVDLLSVEAPAFFIHGSAAIDLLPRHDPADAFHVGHDHHAHVTLLSNPVV